MLINNVRIIGSEGIKAIHVKDGLITGVSGQEKFSANNDKLSVNFENAIAFPGLINSHDHLDFNLFPQLGNRIYNNYTEWAKEIHANNRTAIQKVLAIPKNLRTLWGLYKNLLNGITTVVNHGERIEANDDLVTVIQTKNLHSTKFEKNWKLRLNNPFNNGMPYAMHIGEGTDTFSNKEIDTLIKWNFFKKKIIGIHAVAMNEKQAAHFKAIVWCPESNEFLLGATARIDQLKKKTTVLFGTDSTLSADWNIFKHLRRAREKHVMSDMDLICSVNSTASDFWGLNNNGISGNKVADLVVARSNNQATALDSFFECNPEDILLVVHLGRISLFDEALTAQLSNHIPIDNFSRITVAGKPKYVRGDLPGLAREVKKFHPEANFPPELNFNE